MKNKDIIKKYLNFCILGMGSAILIDNNKNIFYNGNDIFSYGYHYKMATYDSSTFTLYVNTDKYSRTTSKHTNMLINIMRSRYLVADIKYCKFTNGVAIKTNTFKDMLKNAKCIL